ncbi:hypothetical protein LTS10_010000 [Elasticomyces elasticus]|nr:hypothetical protein LTS10_010000 [Elasticomyces elasticus]
MKATMNYTDWRQLWYRGRDKEHLWCRWNNNREAYFASYGRREETITRNIERGMQVFRRWEARLLKTPRQLRGERLHLAGMKALNAFVEALSTGLPTTAADFVFVSIDFEGGNNCAVNQFGFAKLDTRDLIGSAAGTAMAPADIISGHNYALARGRKDDFMFGKTTKTDSSELATRIKDVLQISDIEKHLDTSTPGRNIVLVGHSIQCELEVIENYSINLDDLSTVVGFIDTSNFGEALTLEKLLVSFGLPLPRNRNGVADSLHTAGNDAHYTLRALLAWLYDQYGHNGSANDPVRVLLHLATASLPAWPPKRSPCRDWESYLECETLCLDIILAEELNKFMANVKMDPQEWRQLWYDGPDEEYPWRKYNDNRKVCFAAYYKDNDTILSDLERGMETFIRWEKKLLNIDLEMQAWKERHLSGGLVAMEALIEALATNTMTVEADFVFLSIDFEGDIKYGVQEFGFAKLEPQDLIGNALTPSADMITGHNYALQKSASMALSSARQARLTRQNLLQSLEICFMYQMSQE